MNNIDIIKFLKTSHAELINITKYINNDKFLAWKKRLLPYLQGTSKSKISRLQLIYANSSYTDPYIDEHELKIAEAVLRDTAFKYANKKSKESIEALKILNAREENIDFENELADMICGNDGNFPYRSSMFLTEFFQQLGHNVTHNGETRQQWVKERLEELNVKELHTLISTGLLRKKYFTDFNNDKRNSKQIVFSEAVKEFNEFMKNSITANEAFDLSSVLNMNVNIELLFDQKADTKDIELNKLIEEARERFLKNDKQVALEKLWGAFERLRTFFSEDKKDKKVSATKLVELVSDKFDVELMNEEFLKLGKIGNNYRIRHHETWVFELTSEHINYFFFRMLALVDLCLVFLNQREEENAELFR